VARSGTLLRISVTFLLIGGAGAWVILTPRAGFDMLRLVAGSVFVACVVYGLREPSILNPYLLFAITPASLLAYDATVSHWYLTPLQLETWIVAVLNMVAFTVGMRVSSRDARPRRVTSKWPAVSGQDVHHAIVLTAIGVLPSLYGVVTGLPVLMSGDLLGVGSYVAMMPLASTLMLAKYPAIAFAFKSKKPAVIVAVLAVSGGTLALGFNKSQLALLLVTIVVCMGKYGRRGLGSRRIVGVMVVIALVVAVASVTAFDISRSEFDSTKNLIQKGASWGHGEPLLLPYMYLVSGWTNLDYVIATQPGHTYGLWMLRPLLGYAGLDQYLGDVYTLIPYSNFNTFTFVAVQYKDFGAFGSAILSFVLGILMLRLYRWHVRSTSALVTAVYSLNAVAVLEMFFSNHFFSVGYPVTIVLVSGAYYLIASRWWGRETVDGSGRPYPTQDNMTSGSKSC